MGQLDGVPRHERQGDEVPDPRCLHGAVGHHVDYFEEIDDNDSYYAKVGPQLRAGQDIDRDIITLTDWMAARLIRDQVVQPLEPSRCPTWSTTCLQPLKDASFDPGRLHSITWQSGFAGIGRTRRRSVAS